MLLSESRILSPSRPTTAVYAAPSFSINRCEIRSASITGNPCSRSIAATVLLPLAIPPVKPQRSMHPLFPYFLTSLLPYFLTSSAQFCRLHRIAHQHRNGHRANSSRYRRQRPRGIRHIRVHVTDQHISLSAEFLQPRRKILQEPLRFRSFRHPIGPDINHRRASLNPIRLYKSRPADRRHQNVRSPDNFWQLPRLRMANRHSSVRM